MWFDIADSDSEEPESCGEKVPSRRRGHILDLPDELLQHIW